MSDVVAKLRTLIPGALAGGLSNFAPDPDLPGPLGLIPGVTGVEGAIGLLGDLYDSGRAVVNKGIGTNLPAAPAFFRDVGDRAARTEQQMYEQLQGGPPTEYSDDLLRTGASIAGNALVPGLGWAKAAKLALGLGGVGVASHAAMDAVADTQPEPVLPPSMFGGTGDTTQVAAKTAPSMLPPSMFGGTDTPTAAPSGLLPPSMFGSTDAPSTSAPHAAAFSEAGPAEMNWMQGLIGLATGVIAVGAGRRAYRSGAEIGDAERQLRAQDPAYLKEVNDYQNAVIAGNNQLGSTATPVPPLPPTNPYHRGAVQLQDKFLESGKELQDALALMADNPRSSQQISRKVGLYFDEQLKQQRYRQFMETGHEPVSGVTVPSPTRLVADAEKLSGDDFRLFNAGMAARNEKNIRDILVAERAAKGLPPDPLADRYHFPNHDRLAVEATERQAMANPVIADIINRFDMLNKGIADIREHHGVDTPAVANRIRTTRPNYLPDADTKGLIKNNYGDTYFPSRSGLEKPSGKATALWAQHIEKTLSDVETVNFYRSVADHILEYQKNVPNAMQYLTKIQKPKNPDAVPHIVVDRSSGREYYKTSHPWLHAVLSGENVDRARIHLDSAGKFKQVLQAGTTGAASLATGRIVPLRNMIFTGLQAPINAIDGMYGGPLSWATGARLPRYLTAPIDMPANVAAGIGSWLLGAEKRMAWHASNLFRPENQNHLTQIMRGRLGDAQMRVVSEALKDHYMNSDFYRSRAEGGLGGQSLQQRMRMPALHREKGAFAWSDPSTIRSQMANLNPTILIGMDERPGMRPRLINLRRMITEEFTHASEGVHDFLYSLNKNNPVYGGDPVQTAHAVRNIVGDPSVSGSSPLSQGIRTAVPYANVIVQGNRAAGRAIAATPIETITAMVTGYGTLIAAGMLTAFASQANLDHYTNETSAQERAKFLHVYNGGDGERSLIKIPWPAESSWIAPLLNEIMFNLFNMKATPHDPDVHDDVLGFLTTLLWQHMDKSTVNGLAHNLNDAFNFLDIPPAVKLGITMAGGNARIDFAKAWQDYQTGNLGLNSFVSTPRTPGGLPNQSGDDTITHGENGRRWIEMAGSIFGLSSAVVENVFNVVRYHGQGASWLDAMGAGYEDSRQAARDFNPMGNTLLWDNATRLSRAPPIVEETRRALHEMEKTRGDKTAERMEGTTGGRNPLEVPVYKTDQGKVPDDPTMNTMYHTTAGTLRYLDRIALPEINQIEKQLREVNAMMISPQEKRQWTNDAMRRIADKYRFVAQEVRRLNDDLSRIAGTRVDIRKGINWQGDVSQFKR